ncbi:hypothetical protein NQ318_021929, partial [Aromia moschata]
MLFLIGTFKLHYLQQYEVCNLSNETGIVAPDLATLRRHDLEELVLSGFASDLDTVQWIFLQNINTPRDTVFSRAQVFRWFKDFSEGRESIEDQPRSGRPLSSRTDENVDRIQDLVKEV